MRVCVWCAVVVNMSARQAPLRSETQEAGGVLRGDGPQEEEEEKKKPLAGEGWLFLSAQAVNRSSLSRKKKRKRRRKASSHLLAQDRKSPCPAAQLTELAG